MEVFSFPSSFSEPLGLPPCRISVAVIAELKSLPPHPAVVTFLRYAVPDSRALPAELGCGLSLDFADTSLSRGVAYRHLMVDEDASYGFMNMGVAPARAQADLRITGYLGFPATFVLVTLVVFGGCRSVSCAGVPADCLRWHTSFRSIWTLRPSACGRTAAMSRHRQDFEFGLGLRS